MPMRQWCSRPPGPDRRDLHHQREPERVVALACPTLFVFGKTPREEAGLQGYTRLPPGGITPGEETAHGGTT